ncbi:MAG TPA: HEAT repeat domain-containing protein, partial [Planctomycetaceae bacterium]
QFVRKSSERAELGDDERVVLWALLAQTGEPADLEYAFRHGLRSASVLNELATSAIERKKTPTGELIETLRPLLSDNDDQLRAAAIRLAGAWQLTVLAPLVRASVEHHQEDSTSRLAAIEAIARLDGNRAVPSLVEIIDFTNPFSAKVAAVRALASVDLSQAADRVANEMASISDETQMADFMLPVVNRQGGAELLAGFLKSTKLRPDQAKLAHRVLSAYGHHEPELLAVLLRDLGITDRKLEYSPELVERLAAAAAKDGDSGRGRQVFLSKLANCTACHKVGSDGGDIGPNLSVIGSAMPTPLLIESILWPNRQVKEGFAAIRVITTDGQIFTGYKLKETDAELELRDATTRAAHKFAKADVEDVKVVGSVMPDGLTVGMTSGELSDLIRYLSELGRPTR